MVVIVSSPLKELLAYDLPTCPSSLSAYVYFAAQWRADFEFRRGSFTSAFYEALPLFR